MGVLSNFSTTVELLLGNLLPVFVMDFFLRCFVFFTSLLIFEFHCRIDVLLQLLAFRLFWPKVEEGVMLEVVFSG